MNKMTKRHIKKHKISKKRNIWGLEKFKANGSNQRRSFFMNRNFYKFLLEEKQNLSLSYGIIPSKKLRKLTRKAERIQGNSILYFTQNLECRLDNIVYRVCFGRSIFECRQLVNHGHVLVNNKKVNIPSYIVKKNDSIQIKKSSLKLIKDRISKRIDNKLILNSDIVQPPSYLEVNYSIMKAILIETPKINEIPYKINIEPKYAMEYYNTVS